MNFSYSNTAEVVGQEPTVNVVEEFEHNGRRAVRLDTGATYYLDDEGRVLMPGAEPITIKPSITQQASQNPETGEVTEIKTAQSGGEVQARIVRTFSETGELVDEEKEGDTSLIEEGEGEVKSPGGGPRLGTILTIAAAGVGAYLLLR